MRLNILKCLISILILCSPLYCTGGISFGPGEIIFENLEIGQSYDFGKLSSQQFEVINKFENPIKIKIYKFLPNVLKPNFEPLPDLNWIKVYPDIISNAEPFKKYNVSIKISIPYDQKYLGKNFQFYLQARTESGSFLSLAADARVLIKISEKVSETKITEPAQLPKFEVEPLEIRIKELKLDNNYQISDMKIKNKSEKEIKFQIELLSCSETERPLFPGYEEFPGIKTSGTKLEFFTLKKEKIIRPVINLYLKPDENYIGKKFQFFINIKTLSENITHNFYVPAFIENVVK